MNEQSLTTMVSKQCVKSWGQVRWISVICTEAYA